MKQSEFSKRMKAYEAVEEHLLTEHMPVIVRLDGRAFHTFTKGLRKPFDEMFNDAMVYTMKSLCENITNCIFGYTQSDEITLIVYNHNEEAQPWFNNRLQKIVSVVSSMATNFFNKCIVNTLYHNLVEKKQTLSDEDYDDLRKWENKPFTATFDARAFNIPVDDVINNIIWRQRDAIRNSINALAQSQFSHKELVGKNITEMKTMLLEQKGIDWYNLPNRFALGVSCYLDTVEVETAHGKVNRQKWAVDYVMPLLDCDNEYLNKFLRKEN